LIQRNFLERRHTQSLQKSVERTLEGKSLLDDGGKHINCDRNPDLRLHRILRRSIKCLDPQVLLDPTEEQLHAPAAFIQCRDGQRRKDKIIGQKGQISVVVPVVEPDAAKSVGVGVVGIKARKHNRLITGQVGGPIDGSGGEPAALKIRLGADDEESLALMKNIEPSEIEIAAVEDVETAGLGNEIIQNPDIVHFPVCNLDKRGDGTSQIEKGMELDGALSFAEDRPGEKGKTEVDCRGVEGVNGLLELQPEIVVGIKITGLMNEDLGKVGVDSPVASLVGIGQSASGHTAAESHMVKFGRYRSQARLDIAKTLAVGQLGEGHGEKLVPTREAFNFVAAVVAGDTSTEFMGWKKIDELGEDGFSDVHWPLLTVSGQQNGLKIIQKGVEIDYDENNL